MALCIEIQWKPGKTPDFIRQRSSRCTDRAPAKFAWMSSMTCNLAGACSMYLNDLGFPLKFYTNDCLHDIVAL